MIFLGLGTNLGDRTSNLIQALMLITKHIAREDTLVKVSHVYEAEALLPKNAPEFWNLRYLNIVAALETDLKPEALLRSVKKIEEKMGREDVGRWGPRVIDIDILAYGDEVFASDQLSIPHDGLLERNFVLLPMQDVAPEWKFPRKGKFHGKTVRELVALKQFRIGDGITQYPPLPAEVTQPE